MHDLQDLSPNRRRRRWAVMGSNRRFLLVRLELRLGEVLGLTWADFDKDEGTLTVGRQWTRLGEYADLNTPAARRRIPLSPEIRDELIALKLGSTYSRDEDPISRAAVEHRSRTAT